MAYDKIITIRTRLDDCLRYVQDGEKTALSLALDYIEDSGKTALGDEAILQSAINCTLETCYQDMQRTKERFGKQGGVVGSFVFASENAASTPISSDSSLC